MAASDLTSSTAPIPEGTKTNSPDPSSKASSSFTSPNKGPLTAPSEEIITATENGMIGENCLLGTGSESNVTDGKDAKSDAVQQSKCAHVRWKGSC